MVEQPNKTARYRIYEIVERGHRDVVAQVFDFSIIILIILNVFVTVVGTVDWVHRDWGTEIFWFDAFCVLVFVIEYLLRLWVAPEHPHLKGKTALEARLRTAASPMMVVDLAVLLPFFVEVLFGANFAAVRVLRILRFYRLARYAPAIATIGRVLAAEWRSLLGTGVVFFGLLLLASVVMYFAEGHVQPDKFGDIPSTMWWAVVTLSTVGYGDVIPVTALGKVVAGFTMALGIMFFALPVGIVANGFQEEIKRRDFVVSFAMVAKVPLFAKLEVPVIARMVGLLSAKKFASGALIISKGDKADAMYFITRGEVEIELPGKSVRLGEGDFFGEIALIHHDARRTANVYAARSTDLLVLSAQDFRRLTHQSPELARAVRETAEQRMEQNKAPRKPK
jgi:voltage-gated potassium channel